MAKDELPPDKIEIQGGRVVSLEEWCMWNGEPALTLQVSRITSGYSVCVSDPEHGGHAPRQGATLQEAAVDVLHPEVIGKLETLFGMKNPAEAQIREHHYRKGDGLLVIIG
ncbi:MAG: hypothetical protein WCV69_00690 [Patescibacteria group bacterium]